MLNIVTSELAEADLLDIWLYTAKEWNLTQADVYLNQIGNSLQKLIKHPQLGLDRNDLRKGYRSLLVNHHIVFYRLLEDEVVIMRVLHESVDLKRHI